MGLQFNGTWYRTINDVTEELKTSQKTVKNLKKKGVLPDSIEVIQGARKFHHYDDAWMENARKYFNDLRSKND